MLVIYSRLPPNKLELGLALGDIPTNVAALGFSAAVGMYRESRFEAVWFTLEVGMLLHGLAPFLPPARWLKQKSAESDPSPDRPANFSTTRHHSLLVVPFCFWAICTAPVSDLLLHGRRTDTTLAVTAFFIVLLMVLRSTRSVQDFGAYGGPLVPVCAMQTMTQMLMVGFCILSVARMTFEDVSQGSHFTMFAGGLTGLVGLLIVTEVCNLWIGNGQRSAKATRLRVMHGCLEVLDIVSNATVAVDYSNKGEDAKSLFFFVLFCANILFLGLTHGWWNNDRCLQKMIICLDVCTDVPGTAVILATRDFRTQNVLLKMAFAINLLLITKSLVLALVLCTACATPEQVDLEPSPTAPALPVPVTPSEPRLVLEPGSQGGRIVRSQEQEQALQQRRKREQQRIQELDRTYIDSGEKWFIIDRVWLHSWLCFVNENGPVPSAISNHTLLEPDGAPRSGLEKGRHYRGVNAAVWDFFQNIYGGGPAIPRISLDIYAPHEDAP